MTLKGKVVAIAAVFLAVVPGLCLFFFYGAVKDEVEKENLDRMASYAESFKRAFSTEGKTGLAARETGLRPWPGRVTLIGWDGTVRFDSVESAQRFDNHLDRPEIRAALKDGTGSSLRYSATLRTHLHYYALKTETSNGRVAFIRVAYPVSALTRILAALLRRFALAAVSITVLSVLFWLWLTSRLFRPLEEIVSRSERVGTGEVRFPIFRDVELQKLSTALNAMSERLRAADADIRLRREELARIVEALPVGVLLLDAGLKVRYLNGVTRVLFGDKGEVIKGNPVERLIPSGEIYAMLDGPDACGTVFLTPQGSGEEALTVEVCVISLATGRLMILRDVTESRRMEETRRNFTIDAGHELQTPLTAIRAAAELLLGDLTALKVTSGDIEEKKSLLSTILRQQERMTSLIDDLLLLAKLENPSQEAAKRELEDLLELLNTVASEFRENPSARSVTFEVLTSGLSSAPIMANRPELLRAIFNVVDNGSRKCGGKPGGRVRLELRGEGDRWVTTVSDNGPGVTPEAARRIFRSFQPLRCVQGGWGSGGHGLGLSIAARIVRAHGGSIDLLPSSSLGGAAFEIRLPTG
ncbi:MAG: HAMP domain-containing protein [Synergistaceae bacterium]|jgi:two-component system phosphate regulon sensor histidine kinase PhoR|nr:HAMP domain-containing protein [Synergistaceae bacterium]